MPSKNSVILSRFEPQAIPLLALPSVAFDDRKALPKCAAIYFVLNPDGTVLYIGQSIHLAKRWAAHHRMTVLREKQAIRIAWLVMPDETLLNTAEAACITYFAPPCNGAPGPKDTAKRPGPARKLQRMVDTHLYLPEDLLEWAKDQPEGFAGLVRALLREEHRRRATA